MEYLDLIIFIIAFLYGLVSPRKLIFLFIWTVPYLYGNHIFNLFYLPVRPAPSIALAAIILSIIKTAFFGRATPKASSGVRILGLYMLGVTVAGILLVPPEATTYWVQSPFSRGIRALSADLLFFIFPVSAYILLENEQNRIRALQAIVYSGVFYCSLGILQFFWSLLFGVDLFPMARNRGTADFWMQDVALGGLEGRITSICGEPRYLAVFALSWFTLAWIYQPIIKLPALFRVFALSLFVVTLVLTGSRTGIFGLVLVFSSYLLCNATWGGISGSVKALAVASFFGFAVFYLVFMGVGVLGERLGDVDQGFYEMIDIFGVQIPAEFTEVAAFEAWSSSIESLLFGLGAGLWQFRIDPLDYNGFRAMYAVSDIRELDSIKSNLWVLNILSNYGIIGTLMTAHFYFRHLKLEKILHGVSMLAVIRKTLPLLVLIQIAKSAELLASLMLYLILFTTFVEYREPAGGTIARGG